MRSTLPVVLHSPRILLVGAGRVAAQKAAVLQRNAIAFDVVAQEVSESFAALGVEVTCRGFEPGDVNGYSVVVDATGCEAVARQLGELKEEHGFLLNVVDRPGACDFFFAALVERGPLKVAVSSSGASPAMAQEVRDKIARMLPHSIAGLAEASQQERQAGMIRPDAIRKAASRMLGRVWLVGCGTGAADLLTLRAYRLIREADVALVDHLVSDEIKALLPAQAECVFVGKSKGHACMSQEAINALLIDFARRGLDVVRLKSGDPYVFGRGSEEAEALALAGVHVEVVPGISSAIAGPASAGIPPTARGYATSLSIVSAHLAGDRVNLGWIGLLAMPGHTTIVLMGLSRAAEISAAALESGVDPGLKTAIVSDASRPTQRTLVTTIGELPKTAREAHAPAIIVFGDVVGLHGTLPEF